MENIFYQRFNGELYKYRHVNTREAIEQNSGIAVNLEGCILLGITSENILDLIGKGDYVNGLLVTYKCSDYCKVLDLNGEKTLQREEIDNIITKEKYEKNIFYV